jgi:hypothetical protein
VLVPTVETPQRRARAGDVGRIERRPADRGPGRDVDGEPRQALVATEDPGVVHLVDVVVLGGHPEDRNHGPLGRVEPARQRDRRGGLRQREGRPQEPADLLARDDGPGLGVGELLEARTRDVAGAPTFVGSAQRVHQGAAWHGPRRCEGGVDVARRDGEGIAECPGAVGVGEGRRGLLSVRHAAAYRDPRGRVRLARDRRAPSRTVWHAW